MTQQVAEIKLVCPECRRENEPERIYCHDCGARLDRSGLAKAAKAKEEDPQETRRRLKTMLDPRRAVMRQRFFLLSKMVLAACLVAGLVQMLRPVDLPEQTNASLADIPTPINLELEDAVMDPRANVLHYSEEQVNAYLAYALKSKQTTLSKYLKFERVVLAFDEGVCRVTVERSLYGCSIFTSAVFSASLQDGNLILKKHGGQVGRIPVHPALMRYSDIVFADVGAALERERKNIVKLANVELHPKTVALIPKQPQK